VTFSSAATDASCCIIWLQQC